MMWQSVGLFRDREGLGRAIERIEQQQALLDAERARESGQLDHAGWRRASIITVASLIARAALRREESRGGHFRLDFPARDDDRWHLHISDVISRT